MTQQFDEGVKEIMLALLAIGAPVVTTNYIINALEGPAPMKQKIENLKDEAQETDLPAFNKALRAVEKEVNQDEAIIVKPRINYNVTEDYIEKAAELIIPSEIYGTSMNDPKNQKFLSPYKDDRGLWTIGIGHLIGDGSEKSKSEWVKKNGNTVNIAQVITMFKRDLNKHAMNASRILGKNVFDKLSTKRKAVIIDIAYRGDLNPNHNFVKLIKKSRFKQAAQEYLDHKEYKGRIAKGDSDGVVKRMNRNASIIRSNV